jgi:hypothetical protein
MNTPHLKSQCLVRLKPWEAFKTAKDEGILEALSNEDLNRVQLVSIAE